MATKGLFDDKPLHVLSQGLKSIDKCTEHGHYTRPILLKDEESDSEDAQVHIDYDQKPYYEVAGHPLPCSHNNSMCQRRLRVLRAAAPHFPQLHKFLFLLYNAIREHRPLDSIDTALCAGDFHELCKICGVSDYTPLITTELSSGSCVADAEEPRSLQQPKLPDLELDLHVRHAALIAEIEKKFADDAEFPCCSCERLLQRKQVTAFAFSDAKFCPDMWKSLKAHILKGDSEADSKTHYVCQYCRPMLNKDRMPNRCILNAAIMQTSLLDPTGNTQERRERKKVRETKRERERGKWSSTQAKIMIKCSSSS